MTYERASIITAMIDALLHQTFPPQKILILDNSESDETRNLAASLNYPSIEYYHMGYNSGPAGAAQFGLKRLTAEGFDWIFWGDDDDPPLFVDTFERLFGMIDKQTISPGLVGCVGQKFAKTLGVTRRVPDSVLMEQDFIPVDSIAGNQCMLVNSDVVRAGILPNEKLFFGFEELDFCLKVKNAGFSLVVSSELFLRVRNKFGKLNYKRPSYTKKKISALTREYYSTRNLLVILSAHGLYTAYIYQFFKSLAKSLYGFRFGYEYGSTNFSMITTGVFHALINRQGKK